MKALAVVFVMVLLVPGAAGAPWLQYRADAARTGWTSDPGPATFDVVFDLDIDAERAWLASPLVLDRAVYMLGGRPVDVDPLAGDASVWPSAIRRIDLDTAAITTLVELPGELGSAITWAGDGTSFYVAGERGMLAVDAGTGTPVWDGVVAYPDVLGSGQARSSCAFAAVADGTLYVPCYQDPGGPRPLGFGIDHVYAVFALDVATGEPRWAWVHSVADETPLDDRGLLTSQAGFRSPIVVGHGAVYVVTLEPNRGYVEACGAGVPVESSGEITQPVLRSLDAATGALRWQTRALGGIAVLAAEASTSPFALVGAGGRLTAPQLALAAGPDRLYVVSDDIQALDPATGCIVADDHIRAPDEENRFDRAVALVRDDLVAHNYADLLNLDADTFNVNWRATTDSGDRYLEGGLAATDHHVFALDYAGDVAAYRLADGERVWNADLRADTPAVFSELHAVGEGVYVVGDERGRVLVLGHAGASIQLPDLPPARSVRPGKALTLDLSGTVPGALANDTSFSIAWGDGASTSWTTATVHEHAYDDEGVFTASVHARNGAGQTHSRSFTVDVGATAGALGADASVWAAGLAGLAAVAALGTVVAVRVGRRSGDTWTAGGPTQTATLYRDALEDALGDDGAVSEDDEARLRALRERLGLTDRDHAMLLQLLLDGREGGDLAARLRPGDTFLGKYAIVERLGEGGQGVTLRARDTVLERDVVVKLLHAGGASPEVLLTEARALARLDHSNVVAVHEADRVGSTVFLVMGHVAGGNLGEALDHGPFTSERFAALARDLLAGLAAVHAAGVVHRDLKPANVLLEPEGRAKLADFGVVHVPGLEVTMAVFRTFEGAVGTVPYMSPEQARGRAVDARSDLYSAAVVLYEAATGERLWRQARHESPVELQMRIAAAGAFEGGLPAWAEVLRSWFERALHPEPGERFLDAAEMLGAFEEALDGVG